MTVPEILVVMATNWLSLGYRPNGYRGVIPGAIRVATMRSEPACRSCAGYLAHLRVRGFALAWWPSGPRMAQGLGGANGGGKRYTGSLKYPMGHPFLYDLGKPTGIRGTGETLPT